MPIKYPLTRSDSAAGATKELQAGDTIRSITPDTATKTTAFSALANYSYSLNSSGGTFNVSLPTTADNGAILLSKIALGLYQIWLLLSTDLQILLLHLGQSLIHLALWLEAVERIRK